MGLDMYLTAERFLSRYMGNDQEAEGRRIDLISEQFEELRACEAKVTTVIAEVGYWRKANAIHNWFVQNVQDGKDECEKTYVERELLQKLLDTVNEVLADRSKAEELLPTKSGFFFGDTSIDDEYFEDLEHTKKVLEAILVPDRFNYLWDFYYQSSW